MGTLSSQPDARLGSVLGGRYRIDSVLGQGGMGTVYRGTQLSVEREVAIKLISHQVARQPEFISRFTREAKVTSQLQHPHTIQLHDFGTTDDGALYLVVELLRGQELSRLIEAEGKLPVERALALTQKLLKSLAEAHQKGIVHRDLKPDNVFMCEVPGEGDFPKVMDFGIATAGASPAMTKLTVEGSLLGTPAYMSPEQAQGAATGASADIYALGVMLFEMLTGRLPFEADTAVSLLMKHVNEAPPRLHSVVPDLGAGHAVQGLLDRWMAKDPSLRTQDASQALLEVEALLAGEALAPMAGDALQATSAWDVAGQQPASRPSQQGTAALGTLPTAPSGRAGLWIGAAIVLIGVGVAGALLWPSDPRGEALAVAADIAEPSAAEAESDVSPSVSGAPSVEPQVEPAPEPDAPDALPPGMAPPDHVPATARKTTPHKAPRRVARREPPPAVRSPSASEPPAALPAPPTPRPAPATSLAIAPPATPKVATPKPVRAATRRAAPAPVKPAPKRAAPETRKEKRLRMAAQGAPYPNIRSVKSAYRAKRISADDYADIVWALKRRYKERIRDLKLSYKAGKIDRSQYDRLARQARADYDG